MILTAKVNGENHHYITEAGLWYMMNIMHNDIMI